jgi:hypothetical protein
MNKYAFTKLIHQQTMSLRLLPTLQGTSPLELSSTTSKILSLLSLIEKSSSPLGKIPARTPCGNSSNTSKYLNLFDSAHSLRQQSFNNFPQVANSETSLGLRTPCTAPVLNLHFCENENNVIPPELAEMNSDFCQRTPCGQFHCTPCRKTLAQTEKQLKLIPYSPSLQISDIKYEIIHSRIKENA